MLCLFYFFANIDTGGEGEVNLSESMLEIPRNSNLATNYVTDYRSFFVKYLLLFLSKNIREELQKWQFEKNTEKTYHWISLHHRLTAFNGLTEKCWRKKKNKSRGNNILSMLTPLTN